MIKSEYRFTGGERLYLISIKRSNGKDSIGWSHFQMINNCIFFTLTGLAFIVGYFRQIGFSEIHIGVYGGLIGLAGLFNIVGSWIAQKSGNLKKIYIRFFNISIAFCLAGIVLSYIFSPITNNIIPIIILIIMFLWQVFFAITIPSLLSWLNHIVGNSNWGNFFSTRMMIGDISVIVASFAVGIFLGNSPTKLKFLIIFLVAIIFGLLSNYCMSRVPDAILEVETISVKNYLKVIRNIFKEQRFKFLFLLIFLRAFAYSLIIPFQPLFILERLEMDYAKIAILINLSAISSIVTYKFWARIQTRLGNYEGLKWCTIVSVFAPFLWALSSPNNTWPIYIATLIVGLSSLQGLVGAGYYTSCIGMIFKHADTKHKPIYTSLYFFITGIASTISPVIGGALVDHFNRVPLILPLPNIEIDGYRFSFLVSGIILVLTMVTLPFIKKYSSSSSENTGTQSCSQSLQ